MNRLMQQVGLGRDVTKGQTPRKGGFRRLVGRIATAIGLVAVGVVVGGFAGSLGLTEVTRAVAEAVILLGASFFFVKSVVGNQG